MDIEEPCGVGGGLVALANHLPNLGLLLRALHTAVIQGGDVAFNWANVYAGIVIDKAESRS